MNPLALAALRVITTSLMAAPTATTAHQNFSVSLNNKGGFAFNSGGQNFVARLRISEPGGKWWDSASGAGQVMGNSVTWDTPYFRITRTLQQTGTHIQVSDEITNRSSSLQGLMIQNSVRGQSSPQEEYLGGTMVSGDRQRYNPANPSVYANYGSSGLGIVASDDLLRAQGLIGITAADGLKLVDNSLGVNGGESVKLEWSVYPTQSSDYWDFVNMVRRDWNANFTLYGPFSYEPGDFAKAEMASPRPATYYQNWVNQRGLKYVISSFTRFDDGTIAHGSAIPQAAKGFAAIQSWMKKASAGSSVTPLIYFHGQISTEPDSDQKFGDSKAYDAKGAEIVYKDAQHLPLFIPTEDDSYGAAVKGTLTTLVNSPDIGGIYWDEMSISYPEQVLAGYVYGSMWDGHSVQIDPASHSIVRKKTCVAIATQGIQTWAVNMIRGAGKAIIANTQPYTKTMEDLHYPRYVEGKSPDVPSTQLGVPLVLANMKSEKVPADAMSNAVACFNQGAIYFGWVERYTPNTPDFNQLIWPITPVDIRPGVITGQERIITTRSGNFGFDDGSSAQIYVFDSNANGQIVNVSPTAVRGTKSYAVSVPVGGLAILIKQ